MTTDRILLDGREDQTLNHDRAASKHGPWRSLAYFLLRLSLVPYLVRELVQRHTVTILCYHKPDPLNADRHLDVLRRKYTIISLRDYVESRLTPAAPLPSKALVLTFDDGPLACRPLTPVLQKHKVPVTMFICSGIAGTHRHFWFETPMGGRELARLKTVPDDERLGSLARFGFSELREFPDRQALSWDDIEDMKGVIDFQSHTVFHPVLPRCGNDRSSREIAQSKKDLESHLGQRIYAIAYPNGDYSSREIALAREAGYECALTLDVGFNTRKTPMYRLKRICMTDDAGTDELLVRASGVWDALKHPLKVAKRAIVSAGDRRH